MIDDMFIVLYFYIFMFNIKLFILTITLIILKCDAYLKLFYPLKERQEKRASWLEKQKCFHYPSQSHHAKPSSLDSSQVPSITSHP